MDLTLYKDIYVFAEQREGKVASVSFELVGKARDLADTTGEKVVALLPGYNIGEGAKELIEYGADVVITIDSPHLEHYITEQYAQALYQAIEQYKPSVVLFGATTIGRDLAPRLSARLETGLTADCTKLEIEKENGLLLMTRPAFGGNLMATIICDQHRPQMSTVRPGVMQRRERQEGREGEILTFDPKFDDSRFKVKLIKSVKEERDQIDITEAKVLVSAGRGAACKLENLEGLAKVLNGELAASRAVVDAGVVQTERQVGQTGKTVRPDLYFAIGISGAVQHLAGMEESDFIIAINKDKYASIFQVADLGIVGDCHEIVPLLTERLKRAIEEK